MKIFSYSIVKLSFCLVGFIANIAVSHADETVWQDTYIPTDGQVRSVVSSTTATMKLKNYRSLALDESRMKAQLLAAGSVEYKIPGIMISLPLPDGTFTTLEATPDNILSSELAAKHPDVRVWKVSSNDSRILDGVINFTSLGFHAMISLSNGDTVFIDPENNGIVSSGQRSYSSYSKESNAVSFASSKRKCGISNELPSISSFRSNTPVEKSIVNRFTKPLSVSRMGQDLHTYRLALAATAEFTRDIAGGDVKKAFDITATIVARLNYVYSKMSIKFVQVGGENLIQKNILNDGYTNGASTAEVLWNENQKKLDDVSVLGSNAYDIGHVLTTGSTGWGKFNTTCHSMEKAMGSSSVTPGDHVGSMALDMVAHELGHQFGALHTFNGIRGSCAAKKVILSDGTEVSASPRSSQSAVEPGAGSTIMSYSGLCQDENGDDNLYFVGDGQRVDPLGDGVSKVIARFHAYSIQQINDFAFYGNGRLCATKTSLVSRNPVVNAGTNQIGKDYSYVIPTATPFTLKPVSITGTIAGKYSYAWEQININGSESAKNIDTGDNALVRTQIFPDANYKDGRTIPSWPDLLGSKTTDGEVLPIKSRNLDFRLSVWARDGGIGTGDMRINVVNTGSAFFVVFPTKNTQLKPKSQMQVKWNVAKTNVSPISCTSVDISIIDNESPISRGSSYYSLGRHVNNGISSMVTLPSTIRNGSLIKVACSDNIFFAVSGTTPYIAKLK